MALGREEVVRHQLGESIAVLQAVLDDPHLAPTLALCAERTAAAMQGGHKLMIAGNGGSAADAQHLAAEFVCRLSVMRPALRALALTTDTSAMTAIANDFSFDAIFERQIEALGQAGDVFLAISTSGNSRNVLRAVPLCRERGILTIGLTGNDGGELAKHCDLNVIVPSSVTMHIQEAHLALEHIFCLLVERLCFGTEPSGEMPKL